MQTYNPPQVPTPSEGWLAFYQNLDPARRSTNQAWNASIREEVDWTSERRNALEHELQELNNRQRWLEGLSFMTLWLATVRSRREGMRSILCIYKYDKTSPTGVNLLTAVEDNDQHRAEVAKANGQVFAGAT